MWEVNMMKSNSQFLKATCNHGRCIKATLIWSNRLSRPYDRMQILIAHCSSLMWKEIDEKMGTSDKSQGESFNPFPLMSKGEKWKVLPSMPKGEIVGNMADEFVGIDVNIWCGGNDDMEWHRWWWCSGDIMKTL